MRQKTDDMMGLESSLFLARGAKVMITQNLWTEKGITNGTAGVVSHIIFEDNISPPNLPIALIIKMDSDYIGPHLIGLPNHIVLRPIGLILKFCHPHFVNSTMGNILKLFPN